MAFCDIRDCGRPVHVDGQRCERCIDAGRSRRLPDGVVAFGWHVGGESLRPRTENAGLRFSKAHLALVEQRAPASSGRPRPAYEALCGARKKSQRGTVDAPWAVEGEVYSGDRSWCERCFVLAALDKLHVPTYRTHRTGVSNRYGRGASGSGGSNTHVKCSCGWENSSNVRKRDQEENFRDHVRGAVVDGLFRVVQNGYPDRIVGLWTAAAFEVFDSEKLRSLQFGEAVGGPIRRGGYVELKRCAMPLIPRRAS